MKGSFVKCFLRGIAIIFLCAITFTMISCGNHKLNKTSEVVGKFKNITVLAPKEANLTLAPSTDGMVKVVAITHKRVNCDAFVEEGTLVIDIIDTRNWFDRLFEVHAPEITVYIPAGEYGTLKIDTTTGKINVPSDFLFESISIHGATGDITCNASVKDCINISNKSGNVFLENVRANTLNVSITTGNIELTNVIVTGKMSLESTTGSITFDGCDAGEIYAKASTGNIKGSLLSPKIFLTSTKTGSVHVPRTTNGGVCDLITETGKINITIDE